MRFLWAKASDDDANKEPWVSPVRARRPESREDWGTALGRYPEPGEIIDDLVLEALVRLAGRS